MLRHGGESTTTPKPTATGLADSWQPIKTVPHNASWVEVKMRDGTVQRAHWASDLSGEEQPPFEGWFVDRKTYMLGIPEPVAWRPCPPNNL